MGQMVADPPSIRICNAVPSTVHSDLQSKCLEYKDFQSTLNIPFIDVAFVVDHLEDNYDFFHTEPLLWKLTRQVDNRIEPLLIARDTDYAGLITKSMRYPLPLSSTGCVLSLLWDANFFFINPYSVSNIVLSL